LSLPLLSLFSYHPSPQAEDPLLQLLLPVFPERWGGVRFFAVAYSACHEP
jgi:hypothetical protein